MTRYQVTIPNDRGWWSVNVDAMNEREARAAALWQYNAGLARMNLNTLDALPAGTVCKVVHP